MILFVLFVFVLCVLCFVVCFGLFLYVFWFDFLFEAKSALEFGRKKIDPELSNNIIHIKLLEQKHRYRVDALF